MEKKTNPKYQKTSKSALVTSVLSLVLCFAMLIGTTLAWFTDSVTSTGNIIKSGKLDVKMEWKDATTTGAQKNYKDASEGEIFNNNLWEPGYVEAKNIKISNVGTLALKYNLNIAANGEVSKLADVIDVYYAEDEISLISREMTGLTKVGTLSDILKGMPAKTSGDLLAKETDTVTIALKMQETAGNDYQGLSIGSDFSVILMATQLASETDSFDSQYDMDAGYNSGKTNVGPYKLNVLSGGTADYDEANKTYNVAVKTVAQGGYNAIQGGNFFAGYTVNVAGYGENATVSFDRADGSGVTTWKLADEERGGFINNGVHQQWTRVGRKTAYRYDIDGDGVTDFTVVNDVSSAVVEVVDETGLRNAVAAGNNIALAANITLNESLVISTDKTVAIDLAGYTISQTKECAGTSYSMIVVVSGGSLTIKDSVGTGKVSFNDTSIDDQSSDWASYTIRNNGGVLIVDGGTIEHLGTRTANADNAIFNYDGDTTINGGHISAPYNRSVRQWKGTLTINGGSFDGQVWVQPQSNCTTTINGGSFKPGSKGGDSSSVYVTNDVHTVSLVVSGGNFATKLGMRNVVNCVTGGTFGVEPTAYLADGYVATESNGTWTVTAE